MLITICPSLFYALIVRGIYMFHYRHMPEVDMYHLASATPLVFSPGRIYSGLAAFFARNVRTSDTGKVYLIRIYLTLGCTLCVCVVASIHTVYSFIIPFIFRMSHVDESNWTLRFQVVILILILHPHLTR